MLNCTDSQENLTGRINHLPLCLWVIFLCSYIRWSSYPLYLRPRGQRSKVVSFYFFGLSHVEDFLWTAAQTQADVASWWRHSLLSLVTISTHRWSRLAPPTPGAALKSGHIICPFLSGLLCGAVRCDECSRSRAKPPPVRGWFLTNLAARVKISSAWLVSITAHQLLPHLQSDGTGGMEAHFCPQMETHSLQTSERFNLLCILGALSLY